MALARTPGVFGHPEEFRRLLAAEFDFYEVYGQEEWGDTFMSDLLPECYTRPTIEAALRRLSPDELRKRLIRNPSYVFFTPSEVSARTFLGLPATAGRTIATDPRFFPKGALALISFPKPVFEAATSELPERTAPVTRFVLDQDTGGAITGGGRVDLFWGRGEEAKRYAGVIKTRGRLVYLAPRRPRQ